MIDPEFVAAMQEILAESRPMTEWEREMINEFFWGLFDDADI